MRRAFNIRRCDHDVCRVGIYNQSRGKNNAARDGSSKDDMGGGVVLWEAVTKLAELPLPEPHFAHAGKLGERERESERASRHILRWFVIFISMILLVSTL